MVSPSIIAAVITIVFGVITTLIGLAYRNLVKRVRAIESDTNSATKKTNGLADKVDTVWRYLFGRQDDNTDGGMAQEIEEGFNGIEDVLNEVEKKQETYHEMEMNQLRRLVNKLHDEEELEFERDDVFGDE